ncbi:MAG: UDP-glucose 4-epimerase GalE [Alphaproteobacteria bacterium]
MAILITGGAGYVGSHMAHYLVDKNEPVIVLDDLSRGRRDLVPREACFVHGCAGNGKLLANLASAYDIEAVIHFAGYQIVSESVECPLRYYERNTAVSRTLLEVCTDLKIDKLIFSSTASVYGSPDVIPITEDTALQPISPYGRSKLITEMMIADAGAAHGLRSIILRYFNVAGADPTLRTGQISKIPTHLVKIGSQVALGLRPQLRVFGADYPTPDGTCIRDYVHVMDLADAHYRALEHLRRGAPSATYNVGYGRGYSVLDVIHAFEAVTGVRMPYHYDAPRPGDPPILVADSTALVRDLRWMPRHGDLRDIIRSAYAWEKKQMAPGEDIPLLAKAV